jgi:hypothetical protein
LETQLAGAKSGLRQTAASNQQQERFDSPPGRMPADELTSGTCSRFFGQQHQRPITQGAKAACE